MRKRIALQIVEDNDLMIVMFKIHIVTQMLVTDWKSKIHWVTRGTAKLVSRIEAWFRIVKGREWREACLSSIRIAISDSRISLPRCLNPVTLETLSFQAPRQRPIKDLSRLIDTMYLALSTRAKDLLRRCSNHNMVDRGSVKESLASLRESSYSNHSQPSKKTLSSISLCYRIVVQIARQETSMVDRDSITCLAVIHLLLASKVPHYHTLTVAFKVHRPCTTHSLIIRRCYRILLLHTKSWTSSTLTRIMRWDST